MPLGRSVAGACVSSLAVATARCPRPRRRSRLGHQPVHAEGAQPRSDDDCGRALSHRRALRPDRLLLLLPAGLRHWHHVGRQAADCSGVWPRRARGTRSTAPPPRRNPARPHADRAIALHTAASLHRLRATGAAGSQVELLVGVLNLVSGPGGLISGRLADVFGRKPSAGAACAVCLAGSLLMATAHSYAQLLAGRVITGLGVGCCFQVRRVQCGRARASRAVALPDEGRMGGGRGVRAPPKPLAALALSSERDLSARTSRAPPRLFYFGTRARRSRPSISPRSLRNTSVAASSPSSTSTSTWGRRRRRPLPAAPHAHARTRPRKRSGSALRAHAPSAGPLSRLRTPTARIACAATS